MTTLADAAALGRQEQGLAVVSTLRADSTIQSTLVNAGVLPHPDGSGDMLAFVTYGAVKLANLRARPQVTATFRHGWRFATVEGTATIVGPDDPSADVDAEGLRVLLREVYRAAGGDHNDWDEYDRAMAADRRAVVFVAPTRVYGS